MKKKILWLLTAVTVIAVFVGIYFLYDNLSKEYAQNNIVNLGKEEQQDVQNDQTEIPEEDDDISNPDEEDASQPAQYGAPNFTVYDKDGNAVELWDFVGKPIVLNFWASWCGPCRGEMPHFEKAYKENTDIEFVMVNATTSSNETVSAAKKLIEDNGYTFPVYFDNDGQAAMTYGVYSLPMTMLIDVNGDPIGYVTGMLSEEALDELIEIARTGEVPEE